MAALVACAKKVIGLEQKLPPVQQSLSCVLARKLKSEDYVNEYVFTGSLEDFNSEDCIVEARGRGVTIAVFGDTLDKRVIHPGHLGHRFDYPPSDSSWGESRFLDLSYRDDYDCKKMLKITKHLFTLGQELAKTYTVWVVNPDITGKGYTSHWAMNMNTLASWNDFKKQCVKEYGEGAPYAMVLFVFGLE